LCIHLSHMSIGARHGALTLTVAIAGHSSVALR
jgi:hypothetical protein